MEGGVMGGIPFWDLGTVAQSAFVIGTLFAVVFGIIGGMMAVWRAREKRDGKR
jgi:hypothetical protein